MSGIMGIANARCLPQLRWAWLCLFLLAAGVPVHGQSEVNLKGAIDFRVHSGPDCDERTADADDVARIGQEMGMRALVLTNHYESTAALAYMVRKEVPGIEVFGGIVLNLPVGGINLEAVKRMTMMKGGYGPHRFSAGFRFGEFPADAEADRGDRSDLERRPPAARRAGLVRLHGAAPRAGPRNRGHRAGRGVDGRP